VVPDTVIHRDIGPATWDLVIAHLLRIGVRSLSWSPRRLLKGKNWVISLKKKALPICYKTVYI
jgi:hypothetical protein